MYVFMSLCMQLIILTIINTLETQYFNAAFILKYKFLNP